MLLNIVVVKEVVGTVTSIVAKQARREPKALLISDMEPEPFFLGAMTSDLRVPGTQGNI